jgi:plasmid stabilization system protein ParE
MAFDLVVQFPRHGFLRPDLAGSAVRFKLVYDYLIAYTPESKPILILAVFDGRRNPRIIAASLRSRG